MFFSDFPTKKKETPQRRSETQKNWGADRIVRRFAL